MPHANFLQVDTCLVAAWVEPGAGTSAHQIIEHNVFVAVGAKHDQRKNVNVDILHEITTIIVRSSSLLEDRVGSAFSGKYKSLFLANRGSKRERLAALQDAIAEVYASVFGPDPIEYRRERGLQEFVEEMGVLIQEVVGTRHGDRFYPDLSGVARSYNFYPTGRARPEEGVVNLALGLGKTIVDGGVTWSLNERLSEAFDPHVGWPNQDKMGDYFHMVSDDAGFVTGANFTADGGMTRKMIYAE